MAGPGGWSTTGITFSEANNLQLFRGSDGTLEELLFATSTLNEKLASIAASEHHQVVALESKGGDLVRFNAPENFIKAVTKSWSIPDSFLRNIFGPGSLSRLDFLVESSHSDREGISALNIGFRWGSGHSNYILALGRFDVAKSELRLLLASRGILDLQNFKYQKAS